MKLGTCFVTRKYTYTRKTAFVIDCEKRIPFYTILCAAIETDRRGKRTDTSKVKKSNHKVTYERIQMRVNNARPERMRSSETIFTPRQE